MCQVNLLITEIPNGGWHNGYGPFGSYTADWPVCFKLWLKI